jgi:hypothetical protein
MSNQTKQTINQGILGNQPSNPYEGMTPPTNESGELEQPTLNHQEAFEAQVRQDKMLKEHPQQGDGAYAFEQNGTYCRTGNFENGFIETDLKIVKQKGVEERCVSFTIIQQAESAELYEESGIILVKMEMKSEEQFNNFKNFVANLEWND